MCRYALYYTPDPDSRPHAVLSSLLGRDALRDISVAQPALQGISAELLQKITAVPASYGVHATLKAPFHLLGDATESLLLARVRELAAVCNSFYTPPLVLSLLEQRFFALTCAHPCPALCALEMRFVMELDSLRAPLTPQDIARRGPLNLRQKQNLSIWGYHKVLADFVFHISLTAAITDRQLILQLEPVLREYLQPVLDTELHVHGMSVFKQNTAQGPFSLLEYAPFGDSPALQL